MISAVKKSQNNNNDKICRTKNVSIEMQLCRHSVILFRFFTVHAHTKIVSLLM